MTSEIFQEYIDMTGEEFEIILNNTEKMFPEMS